MVDRNTHHSASAIAKGTNKAKVKDLVPGRSGRVYATSSVDWITAAFLSRQNPSADQVTSWMATKFNSRVVMISLTSQKARASAGTKIQAAPAAMAARAMTASTSQPGPSMWMPTPTAAKAPTRNWPSEPMFHTFMRSDRATPRAVIRMGMARRATPSMPRWLPKMALRASKRIQKGLRPVISSSRPTRTRAPTAPATRVSAPVRASVSRRRTSRQRPRITPPPLTHSRRPRRSRRQPWLATAGRRSRRRPWLATRPGPPWADRRSRG